MCLSLIDFCLFVAPRYEWDLLGYTGPDEYYSPCPPDTVNCGFDTNYPNYLTTRTGFDDTRIALQSMGVSVFPYINGRIYDQSTENWESSGKAGAVKMLQVPTTLVTPEDAVDVGLDLYNESYGSQALFAVMCPHDTDWQGTISSTVGSIIELGVDGVYIDQVGAAGPKPCFDPSHGHDLGGGDWWVGGYREMLTQSRAAAAAASPDRRTVLLTESNSESFIGALDVMLTLVAFEHPNYAKSSNNRQTGAFPAIYGGYTTGCGSEFFQDDLNGNGDVFAAKIAQQFLMGAQMGWMSLGGRDNQDPPMGLYDLLMDPSQDATVDFIKTLSGARAALNATFFDGRASRDLEFEIDGASDRRRSAPDAIRGSGAHPVPGSAPHLGLEYDAVAASVWLDDAGPSPESLTVVFVGVESGGAASAVSFGMDAARFGLAVVDAAGSTLPVQVSTVDLVDGSEVPLGTFAACCVRVEDLSVAPRAVAALRIRVLQEAK